MLGKRLSSSSEKYCLALSTLSQYFSATLPTFRSFSNSALAFAMSSCTFVMLLLMISFVASAASKLGLEQELQLSLIDIIILTIA